MILKNLLSKSKLKNSIQKQSKYRIDNRLVLYILLILILSFLLSFSLFYIFDDFFNLWNTRINDNLFLLKYKIKGKETISPQVVHFDITDSTYQKYEDAILDRSIFIDLIKILTKANVNSIVFDIIFHTKKDPQIDLELIKTTKESGRVFFPIIPQTEEYRKYTIMTEENNEEKFLYELRTNKKGEPLSANYIIHNITELENASKGLGHIYIEPDIDGIYRRIPLVFKYHDNYILGISLKVVCDYLKVKNEDIIVNFGSNIILKNAKFPLGYSEDIKIPIDNKGRMIVNYAGPWDDSFSHYSSDNILNALNEDNVMLKLQDEIEDFIFIISDIATRGKDHGTIPIEKVYPLSGIHANTINSIISNNFIKQFNIFQLLIINLIFVIILFLFAINFRAFYYFILSLLTYILYIIFNLWLFIYNNYYINLISPTIAFILSLVFIILYYYHIGEKEKVYLKTSFEKYFSPHILDKIIKNPLLCLVSEKKILTIIFSDISGFTAWSETQTPEIVHKILNEYFDEMAKIVFKYEGTIDKFIGDGLMVFFGDPITQPDHAIRAVKAAIEMQQKVRELKNRWQKENNLVLTIRIGINTGEVIVGNMGASNVVDYTVIGANVNLAQRLESSAPLEGILISQNVYKHVKNIIKIIKKDKIKVKGFKNAIPVYQIKIP